MSIINLNGSLYFSAGNGVDVRCSVVVVFFSLSFLDVVVDDGQLGLRNEYNKKKRRKTLKKITRNTLM